MPRLVSKIRTWKFTNIVEVRLMTEIFPEAFAPEVIVYSGLALHPEYPDFITDELWGSLVRMESLKHLELHKLESEVFLWGLPPNLEELKVSEFHMHYVTDADLAPLKTSLESAQSKIRLSLRVVWAGWLGTG